MSTAPLKGAVLSPTRRAILQYLQMHGECSRETLQEAMKGFRTWRITSGSEPVPNSQWMSGHLMSLRAAGHIRRRIVEGVALWSIGTEPVEMVELVPSTDLAPPPGVATPRQVDVMFGPVYVPGASASTRPGADAHASYPSLIGGQRVAYRSPTTQEKSHV